MRNWAYEGILAQPAVYLNQPGNYLLVTLLTETLALGSATYGGLLSIPFWCNVLQLFIVPGLLRRRSAKHVFLAAIAVTICSWLLAASLLYSMAATPVSHAIVWFAFLYAISSLGTSVGSVTWTHWIHGGLPQHARGPYFARRNRLLQVALLTYIVSAMALFHWIGAGLMVFAGICTFAGITRAISLTFAFRNPIAEGAARDAESFWQQFAAVRGERRFLLFVATGACWGMTANLATPFIPVFLLRELHWTSGQVGAYFVCTLLAGALAFPTWGRLMNRYGPRPVMLVALLIWSMLNVGWLMMSPALTGVAYGLGAGIGAANAGMVLGNFHLVLTLAPTKARPLAIGLNTALTALATAVAPLAAGASIAWAQTHAWASATSYRPVFVGQLAACALTALLLRRLREPAAVRFREVIGGMTNLRTLGATLGLGFLVEYIFTAPVAETPRADPGRRPDE
jgi:hypothetical protein